MAINTKVRGVTHRNRDGSKRQKLIKRCRPGQRLLLIREPDNQRDRNAVMVCARRGLLRRPRQLGYLSADLAEQLAPRLDACEKIGAVVLAVTGGGGMLWWRKARGLNILLTET